MELMKKCKQKSDEVVFLETLSFKIKQQGSAAKKNATLPPRGQDGNMKFFLKIILSQIKT